LHLNVLAAVLLIGLVVGSLIATFSIINQNRMSSSLATKNSVRVVLVPAEKGNVPSQTKMEAQAPSSLSASPALDYRGQAFKY